MNILSFIKSNWVLIFFLGSFTSIFLLIFTKKYKLLTFLISSYVSLLLLSILIGFLVPNKDVQDRRKFVLENKADAIFFSPSNFINSIDGRKKNEMLKFNVDNDLIKFPLSGIPNEKIIACEEDEGPIIRQTDRFGFYNNDSLWDKKNSILLIGDSHANGDCVFNTPFKILNKKFDINTISLGMGGNGPLVIYAITKEYFKKFKSDYVYYIMSTNDYSRENFSILSIDLSREISNETLMKTLNTSYTQGYFEDNALIKLKAKLLDTSNNLVKKYDDDIKKNKKKFLIDFFSLRYFLINIYNLSVPFFKPGIRFLTSGEEIIFSDILKKLYLINDKKTIFVIRPNINCSIRNNDEYEYLLMIFKKINIPNTNIINSVSSLCDRKFWSKKGNHLNSEGYKILSKIIYDDYTLRNN